MATAAVRIVPPGFEEMKATPGTPSKRRRAKASLETPPATRSTRKVVLDVRDEAEPSPSPAKRRTPGAKKKKTPAKAKSGDGEVRQLFGGSSSPKSKEATTSTSEKELPQPSKEARARVSKSYEVVRKATGALGGNADGGAIYGELTEGSMGRIIANLEEYCGFDAGCTFIDVGAGLGKPNIHAAQHPGCVCSYGVELMDLRYKLSMVNLKALLEEDCLNKNLFFSQGDIYDAQSFSGFTHVYMYDLGFPPEIREHIANMWAASGPHTRYLVSYIRPNVLINEYEMEIEEMTYADGEPLRVATSMHGSAEGHTAYFYKRVPFPEPTEPFPEDAAAIAEMTDEMFKEGFRLVGGPLGALKEHTENAVSDFLGSGRRTRSSRRRAAARS